MSLFDTEPLSDALISDCGQYRYWLTRYWDAEKPTVAWVMLNPSTADHRLDDPTIRRCIAFSKDWGFGGLSVVNLYAYRSPSPKDLWKIPDPIGPDNDKHLVYQTQSRHVIAAWGKNAKPDRAKEVFNLIHPMAVSVQALKLTKDGQPWHPLYVPGNTERITFKI